MDGYKYKYTYMKHGYMNYRVKFISIKFKH